MRVRQAGEGNRTLSGFWGNCPIAEIQRGADSGVFVFDDFHNTAGVAISTNTFLWAGDSGARWSGYGATGVTMQPTTWATTEGGVGLLEIDTDASGEGGHLQAHALTYASNGLEICTTAGSNDQVFFEARMRRDTIGSTTGLATFVGLGTAADHTAADEVMASGGADVSLTEYLGFRNLIADGDGMDAVYQKTGVAEAVALEAASTNDLNVSADTFYKLGIWYDGTRVHWYIDGKRQVSKDPLSLTASFPDNVAMYPTIGFEQAGAGDFEIDVDWMAWSIVR